MDLTGYRQIEATAPVAVCVASDMFRSPRFAEPKAPTRSRAVHAAFRPWRLIVSPADEGCKPYSSDRSRARARATRYRPLRANEREHRRIVRRTMQKQPAAQRTLA